MTQPIRTLVLSGGGGRGAFHAGVYKYLMQAEKPRVDAAHRAAWEPDIVVGTSIGAVNGAAIVQGMAAEELEQVWLRLREHHIQGLPPGMRGLARWLARRAMRSAIGVDLPQIAPGRATSPVPGEFWPPLPFMPRWLAERLVGHWINLLDTGPLLETMRSRLGLDEARIAASPKTLLIAATNVQTGERMVFSNKALARREDGQARPDTAQGITLERILASCSIPLVYPWTYDAGTQAYYWDGAVVSNTPLGGALDAVRETPAETPMEVVVVLMTPWWRRGDPAPARARQLPASFDEAVTWSLDWALLASFRERLRLTEAYNLLARQERERGGPPYRYREVKVMIVAPQDFFPAARILDYDQYSAELVQQGYGAAARVFREHFPE
jgi:NTE family protein